MFNKNQSLDKIAIHSGNLVGKLRRLDLDLDFFSLAESFESSINNGGLDELEFKRPSGQSYNPRPARVAQILIESKTTLTSELLIASFLVCSVAKEKNLLAQQAILILEDLKTKAKIEIENQQSLILALALHLDHARHFHLGELVKDKKENKIFCELTEKLILLAEDKNSYLYLTTQHWLKRHQIKHGFLN